MLKQICLSAALIVAPIAADAACVQSDLAGTWQFYQTFGSEWNRCTVSIDSGGAIANASCRASFNNTVKMLTNGTVTLTSPTQCIFSGHLKMSGAINILDHGALSRDKLSAAGVGSTAGSAVFTFSMVKR